MSNIYKIYNIMSLLRIAIISAVSLTVLSCASESDLNKNSQGDVALKINIQIPSQTNVSTRATTLSSNESTVNDLTVFIFNSDKQLIGESYVPSPTSTGTNTYKMTVSTREATNCTVYAVANAGANAFTTGNSNVSGVSNPVNTIDEFKEAYAKLSAASDLGSQSNVIMAGVLTNQYIISSTQTLANTVPLYRLCTKVNFNIIPASNITITGYQLHEVPASSYIADRSAETTPAYNPSGSYEDFNKVPASSPTAGSEVTDAYYIYENLAGKVATSNTAKSRNATNAPATASYLDVYATGPNWQSTYRIYLGGTGTTDYTNYNIPRNYNYTYTINITGSGIYDVRVTCYPELINSSTAGTWGSNGSATAVTSSATANVGDYYFSDGTWGSLANNPGKTPIAVVFSGTTSATDQGHGWTHGYAMALTNAPSSTSTCIWSTSTTTNEASTLTNNGYTYEDHTGGYTDFETDKDGYTETHSISNYYSSMVSDHPAFWYALNYGTNDESATTTYNAPNKSSGWFLPSIGQLWDIVTNLGKMSTTPTNYNTSSCWWTNSSSTCITNINKYLSSISGYKTPDYFTNNNDYYWSSSEYNSSSSYILCFAGFGDCDVLMYSYTDINNYKNTTRKVRSIIAF